VAARAVKGTVAQKKAMVQGGYNGLSSPFVKYAGFGTPEGVFPAAPQDKLHHFKCGVAKDLRTNLMEAVKAYDPKKLKTPAADASALWSSRLQALARFTDPEGDR
jgi:hypothetical protein